jgi:serine/threonine protein phosphatase 1
MRTLAIGDVHGCRRALDALLDVVAPAAGDTVVFLGDYVDRGPDTRGVIERLLAWPAGVRLVTLRGNHEEMMLWAFEDAEKREYWRRVGGEEVLQSYGLTGLEEFPEEHRAFLESTGRLFEAEHDILVHAGVVPELSLDAQPDTALYWERFPPAGRHVSGKRVVCGHTLQPSGEPNDLGYAVCIDTGCYVTGWLTCLDVAAGRYWQASERGRTRTGSLRTD